MWGIAGYRGIAGPQRAKGTEISSQQLALRSFLSRQPVRTVIKPEIMYSDLTSAYDAEGRNREAPGTVRIAEHNTSTGPFHRVKKVVSTQAANFCNITS